MDANDGDYPSYARVDSPCWAFRTGWHPVAAHEVRHMLGAVRRQRPASTGAGHCVDETDVMCYDDGGIVGSLLNTCSGRESLFDCRNDDYFNVNPPGGSYLTTHWNPADSTFLDRVRPDAVRPPKSVGRAVFPAQYGLSNGQRAQASSRGETSSWSCTSLAARSSQRA